MAVFNYDVGEPANRRAARPVAAVSSRHDAGAAPSSGLGFRLRPGLRPGFDAAANPVDASLAECAPRVMVVDDNPVNRMLACELLSLWGVKPLLAEDGSQAVALACERPLALILMDLQMPVLDGLGATLQIRRFEAERSRPRVPIVAYTSAFFGTDPKRLQHFGLDGLLAKPCEVHELHECLLRWCPAISAAAAVAFADTRDGVRDRVDALR